MSNASYRDAIFSTPLDRVARFSFDEQVVACFPDMIRRSVPGYGQILGMLGLIADRHLRHGAHVYDLGCSLGAASLALAGQLPPDAFRLTAVDLSPAMVERARETLAAECPEHAIEVIEGDIRSLDYRPSGMVILNFTLQFLPPRIAKPCSLDSMPRWNRAAYCCSRKRWSTPTNATTPGGWSATTTSSAPTATASWRSARSARRWRTCWCRTPWKPTMHAWRGPASRAL